MYKFAYKFTYIESSLLLVYNVFNIYLYNIISS